MAKWCVTLEASVVRQLHIAQPIAHDFLVLGNIEAMAFLQLIYVNGMVVGGAFTAGIIGSISEQDFSGLVSQGQSQVRSMGTKPAHVVTGYIVNHR